MSARGVAIDEAAPPEWIRDHVAPGQLRLQRSLLWIVAMYESPTLGKAEINVAQRLHIATEGQDKKERQLSHAELAHSTKQSQQTNITAVKRLEAEGWLLVERVNNRVNRYRLAWPVEDMLAEEKKSPPLCGEPTKKDTTCTRKAGWGTVHQGVGKCVLHEPKGEDEDGEELPAELQLLESEEDAGEVTQLQPLESEGEAAVQTEPSSTPIDGSFNSNNWSPQLQPLEHPTPTIGALYVGTAGTQLQVRKSSPVLAVGERTVRTARDAVKAPSAQPEFSAQQLVNAVPRYRAAPGWAKPHLVRLIDAAIAEGYGTAAIARYAEMLAAEVSYREDQHTLELRGALGRLKRDVQLGDACPSCGLPECRCPAEEQPDAELDPAVIARTLAYLRATPDELSDAA